MAGTLTQGRRMNDAGNIAAIVAVVVAVVWLCSDDRPKIRRDSRPLVIIHSHPPPRSGGGIGRGLLAGAALLLVLGVLAALTLFVVAAVVGVSAVALAVVARAVRGPMPRSRGRASAHHDPHDIPDTGFDLRPPHIRGEIQGEVLDGSPAGDEHTRDPAVNRRPDRDTDQ